MTKQKIIFRTMASVLVLGAAACAKYDMPNKIVDGNMAQLAAVNETGNAFSDSLTEEYRQLAMFEYNRMVDERDANRWAVKGVKAARNGDVMPEDPKDWDLPASARKDVNDGYAALIGLRNGAGKDAAPDALAKAQTSFDCWVEQLEENFQPKHIEICRKNFVHALQGAQTLVANAEAMKTQEVAATPKAQPKPAPEPANIQPVKLEVFFDFDKAELRPVHDKEIAATAKLYKQRGGSKVVIEGHADRSGTEQYNRRLSEARAKTVTRHLVAKGVSVDDVVIRWRGENDTVIDTKDGVRNELNRRVEIFVE